MLYFLSVARACGQKNKIDWSEKMETLNQILDELDTGQELIDYNIIKKGDELNDKQEIS